MADEAYDVFLSYSTKDEARVEPLAERLRADGVRVWFDRFALEGGDHVYRTVQEGLAKSRHLALFLSPSAVASGWVEAESGAILYRDPSNRENRLIPILLADCEVPELLAPLRQIDLRSSAGKDFEDGYRLLLRACRRPAEGNATVGDRQRPPVAAEDPRTRRAHLFPRLACPDHLRSFW